MVESIERNCELLCFFVVVFNVVVVAAVGCDDVFFFVLVFVLVFVFVIIVSRLVVSFLFFHFVV